MNIVPYFLKPYKEYAEYQQVRIKHLTQGLILAEFFFTLFLLYQSTLGSFTLSYKTGILIFFIVIAVSLFYIAKGCYHVAINILNLVHVGLLFLLLGVDKSINIQSVYVNVIIGSMGSIVTFLFINIVACDKSIFKLSLACATLNIIIIFIGYFTKYNLGLSILGITPIIALYLIINILVILFHQYQTQVLEQSNAKIQELLKNSEQRVEKLEKILPICSFCKRIRKEDENWEEIDNYIHTHNEEIGFSHSICPECSKKYYNLD